MRKIEWTKMVATGNDFVVIDNRGQGSRLGGQAGDRVQGQRLARLFCQRKTGIGADGLLVIESSKKADFKMRIFNPDGSEAEMCGNGLRCAALLESKSQRVKESESQRVRESKGLKIETMAGIYEVEIRGRNNVRIRMDEPKDFKGQIPITVQGRHIKVSYIDVGVPHTLIFVSDIDKIDVESIGRNVRNNKRFKPRGTNVDFVEIIDDNNIKMRTFERGVEGETLACGTGAVASAIVTNTEHRTPNTEINVHTKGGDLKVYFNKIQDKIKDVYLEGEAKELFKGEILIYA